MVLHWKSARDGKRATADLEFEVENTTDQPIDVDIQVGSYAGEHQVESPGATLRVAPREAVAESFPVKRLGVQLVGNSAITFIVATYQGPDGITRSAPLNPVLVEHEPGFGKAYVRDGLQQARENAKLGLARLQARRPTAARTFDAVSDRMTSIEDTSDLVSGSLMLGSPELLGLEGIESLPKPGGPDAVADIPDAERTPDAANAVSGTFSKGGVYNICMFVPYFFQDALFGEDYLAGQQGSTLFGIEPARYMFASVVSSSGSHAWIGYLDAFGCTPAFNLPNGDYTASVAPHMASPNGGGILTYPYDDGQWLVSSENFSISGSGGALGLAMTSFLLSISTIDAAVAAGNTLFRSTDAYPAGTQTTIISEESCPSVPGSGCIIGSKIYLGVEGNGTHSAWFKVVTEHELGHRVQGALFGMPSNSYNIDATQASCRCDHIPSTTSNNLHCLQSRHSVSAAQVEGWAQFFAAANLNNGTHNDCTFVYYKEFRNDNGSVTSPPLAKSCFNQVKWMENHCNASGRGTEYDWMGFYWRLDKKDSYSFANFTSVYQQACGGSCAGQSVAWGTLASAAVTTFGVGSSKAIAWSGQGDNYGVDH